METQREREGQLWEEEVKIEKEAETAEAEAKAEAEAEAEAEGGLVERWRFQRFSTTTASNGTGHGVFTEQSVGDEAIVIERGKEKDQMEYYFYLTYTNIPCIYRYSFFFFEVFYLNSSNST